MTAHTLTIIYDGECPFCSSYVRMARLREAAGTVELVDARSNDPRVAEAWDAGLDLDDGMVVLWQGERHYGAEAVHLIASLSGEGGFGNRLQRRLFRSRRAAAALYPWLVRGRRLWLRLVGRTLIGPPKRSLRGVELERRPPVDSARSQSTDESRRLPCESKQEPPSRSPPRWRPR